jgi:hypothetical protein
MNTAVTRPTRSVGACTWPTAAGSCERETWREKSSMASTWLKKIRIAPAFRNPAMTGDGM